MPVRIIILRTIILYLVLLVMIRIMGKRELGQLSPFDFVVSILIAELAAIPMESEAIPLYHGIVPIVTLVLLQIALSYISVHNETIRRWINGAPAILIRNGQIQTREMVKNRCDINDLIIHLREKGIYDIGDVEFAILEPSGALSVIPRSQKRSVTPGDLGLSTEYEGLPVPLITDGIIHKESLREIQLDEKWLFHELAKHSIFTEKEVLYACLNTKGELYVAKKE